MTSKESNKDNWGHSPGIIGHCKARCLAHRCRSSVLQRILVATDKLHADLLAKGRTGRVWRSGQDGAPGIKCETRLWNVECRMKGEDGACSDVLSNRIAAGEVREDPIRGRGRLTPRLGRRRSGHCSSETQCVAITGDAVARTNSDLNMCVMGQS